MCLELRRDLFIGLRASTGVANNFIFVVEIFKENTFSEYASELTKVNANRTNQWFIFLR